MVATWYFAVFSISYRHHVIWALVALSFFCYPFVWLTWRCFAFYLVVCKISEGLTFVTTSSIWVKSYIRLTISWKLTSKLLSIWNLVHGAWHALTCQSHDFSCILLTIRILTLNSIIGSCLVIRTHFTISIG